MKLAEILKNEFNTFYLQETEHDAYGQPITDEFMSLIMAFLYTKIDQLVEDKIRYHHYHPEEYVNA